VRDPYDMKRPRRSESPFSNYKKKSACLVVAITQEVWSAPDKPDIKSSRLHASCHEFEVRIMPNNISSTLKSLRNRKTYKRRMNLSQARHVAHCCSQVKQTASSGRGLLNLTSTFSSQARAEVFSRTIVGFWSGRGHFKSSPLVQLNVITSSPRILPCRS
jgi:hypothetical protein